MKRAGMDRAYRYAASRITGSGVQIFTSSFSMLMIHSVVEKGIILSQAKKADKIYEDAVREINRTSQHNIDSMCSEVIIKEFYPALINLMLEFDSKIMSVFLTELATHGKFDFESVEKYDMRKSEEMLKNINRVPDKVAFLKQTFSICPFGLEVYEECLKQGLLDKDTFETAKYFGMGEELAEKMDDYIKSNLKKSDKIKPIISMCIFRPLRFFLNYPFCITFLYLNFASSNFLPQRPYMVRFIIFNLLFVPSTNPLL